MSDRWWRTFGFRWATAVGIGVLFVGLEIWRITADRALAARWGAEISWTSLPIATGPALAVVISAFLPYWAKRWTPYRLLALLNLLLVWPILCDAWRYNEYDRVRRQREGAAHEQPRETEPGPRH